MTRKKAVYTVKEDLSDVFRNTAINPEITVADALDAVLKQLETTGYRQRTLYDYNLHIRHFIKITEVNNLSEITIHHIYDWLQSMKVSNATKLIRLKCLKAFFGRCHKLGWFSSQFWSTVNIKVDSPIKEGTTEQDINTLLGLLELNDFFQLRDATAILLMYRTGIRIGTLSKLTEKQVNIAEKILKIDGKLLKNHEQIHLPFDDAIARLLSALISQNEIIREMRVIDNNNLFISKNGSSISSRLTNNIIQKRLQKYSEKYGLQNLNPHALRRGFAKNLLNKGADITLISKALGHSSIAVTTRYLHYDKLEVAEDLRKFL